MTDDRFGIVGKVIARTYHVEDVVAEGGFGVVYRAYHKGFRAMVALKCLKIPDELSEDQRTKFLEQFRSEAEVLFRLSGQIGNIVRPLHVDAFHADDGRLVPFMALEWLEGRTLDAIIMRRAEKGRPPITLSKLVRLLTPVAGALEQAHHLQGPSGVMSVVHRDMKPENLFVARVGDEDIAKVLDFGISKVKSTAGQMAGRASQTQSAFVSFSPAYAAPEQWAPKRYGQTGRWTDVWGLALTVVEAAKGAEVICGDHAAMMGSIIDPEHRPTPRNEGIEVSDSVEAIFAHAMAVDPRERYQSVGQFWDDLTSALGIQSEVGAVSIKLVAAAQRKRGRATTGFDSLVPPASEGAPPVPPLGSPGRVPAAEPLRAVASTQETVAHAPPQAFGLSGPSIDPTPSQAMPRGRPVQPSSSSIRLEGAHPSGARRPQQSYSGLASVPSRPRPIHPSSPYGIRRVRRPSVWKSLSPALALMGLSLAFTALDRAFLVKHGVPLAVGGVKASWIAAGLMVFALISGIGALRRHLD